LSPDPDNAFFASGVHEEVLTRLSLIPELRVISRTSMEKSPAMASRFPRSAVAWVSATCWRAACAAPASACG
jgi:TolB-like protein